MTILRYDEPKVIKTLANLPSKLRVAFALLCAERALPGYVAFCERTGNGNVEALNSILDRVWRDLGGSAMSEEELDASFERAMNLIPPEDQGTWSHEQAYAEDAAAAVAYAVRSRKRGDPQDAAWAARRTYEALDSFVINHHGTSPGPLGAEERILSHPIIQAELSRQNRDLNELLKAASIPGPSATLAALRAQAKEDAKSLFDPHRATET
jgi:uncharacterized protein YjaG (DUF416 family)